MLNPQDQHQLGDALLTLLFTFSLEYAINDYNCTDNTSAPDLC
jgi:hypothetical protein